MDFKVLSLKKKSKPNMEPEQQERKKQRKARKRKAMTPFYIILSLFIAASAIYLCLSLLFNVEKITIIGNTIYDESELIKTSGIGKGDNLFKIDTEYAENKLYSVYNYIEAAEVKRSFPNGVKIIITEVIPFAAVEEADGYTLISTGGKVLERSLDEVPYGKITVRGFSTVTNTEEDAKRIKLLQNIMDVMQKFDMKKYNLIDLTDTLEITMIYNDRVRVEMGNELELEYKLQFINEIIKNKLPESGFFLLDASTVGEVMTKELTMSPWDFVGKYAGTNFADEDEE